VKKVVKLFSVHVALTKLTLRVGYIAEICCSIVFGTPVARVCRIFSNLKTLSSHVGCVIFLVIRVL
jgi:hypothetical protein